MGALAQARTDLAGGTREANRRLETGMGSVSIENRVTRQTEPGAAGSRTWFLVTPNLWKEVEMTAYSLPQSSIEPKLGFHCSFAEGASQEGIPEAMLPASPDPPSGGEGRRCLTPQEWEALEDVAMSLHGVMRLIEEEGFNNSSGAQELLVLVYRRYERLLAEIRSRLEKEGEL